MNYLPVSSALPLHSLPTREKEKTIKGVHYFIYHLETRAVLAIEHPIFGSLGTSFSLIDVKSEISDVINWCYTVHGNCPKVALDHATRGQCR